MILWRTCPCPMDSSQLPSGSCRVSSQRPGRLRRGAGSHAAGVGIVVAAAGLAPAAVGILHHANPLGSLLNLRLKMIDADGIQSAQHPKCAVDIVHAPAAEPTSARLLLTEDESDGLQI